MSPIYSDKTNMRKGYECSTTILLKLDTIISGLMSSFNIKKGCIDACVAKYSKEPPPPPKIE